MKTYVSVLMVDAGGELREVRSLNGATILAGLAELGERIQGRILGGGQRSFGKTRELVSMGLELDPERFTGLAEPVVVLPDLRKRPHPVPRCSRCGDRAVGRHRCHAGARGRRQ